MLLLRDLPLNYELSADYLDVTIFPVTVQIPFSRSNPPNEDIAITVESLIWHREFHKACACGASVGNGVVGFEKLRAFSSPTYTCRFAYFSFVPFLPSDDCTESKVAPFFSCIKYGAPT